VIDVRAFQPRDFMQFPINMRHKYYLKNNLPMLNIISSNIPSIIFGIKTAYLLALLILLSAKKY